MLRRLFDGELLIPFEDQPSPERLLRMVSSQAPEMVGSLIQKLCLYDQIVIPTVDMALIPMLPALVGPNKVLQYLEDGVIRFVRYRGFPAYIGAGNGLEMMEIRSPNNPPPGTPGGWKRKKLSPADKERWKVNDAASSELDEAMATMLAHFRADDIFGSEFATDLSKKALAATDEVTSGSGFFKPAFDEAYRDVREDQALSTLFASNGVGDLRRIPGVEPNQSRWLHERLWNDPIDVLLHLAQFNLEVALARRSLCQDQTAGPSAYSSLSRKARRVMSPADARRAFEMLVAVNGMPDFTEVADNDELLAAILVARDSADGEAFRKWVHANLKDSPEELAAAFSELSISRGVGDLGRFKALRFVVSTAAQGLATLVTGPPGGVAVGFADTFLLDNFLRRDPSPKVFVRELKGSFGTHSALAN